MRILCQKCQSSFEIPLKIAGKIEYEHCENVFRVSLKFRTPCPKCRIVLQLIPTRRDEALGVPIPADAGEKTEMLNLSPAGEPTLPRQSAATERTHSPAPTVRVARTPAAPQPPRPKFLITSARDFEIQRPLHVNLAPRFRTTPPFNFRKIVLGSIIAASLTLTALMTVLAVQGTRPHKEPPGNPVDVPTRAEKRGFAPPDAEQLSPKDAGDPREDRAMNLRVPDGPAGGPAGKKVFYVQRLDQVTSDYGLRLDPIDFEPRFHRGMDVAEPNRAEIVAALDGTVTHAGLKGGYGNIVILSHDDGYETLYGHLAKVLVRKGRQVRQGDLIGLAGSTGRSTGTHLHFEVKKDGKSVDPYRVELMSKAPKRS